MESKIVGCVFCHKTYSIPLFRYRYNQRLGRQNLCSLQCRNRFLVSMGFKRKTRWERLTCFQCKRNFQISKTLASQKRYRKTHKTFCSALCKRQFQERGGKWHPCWKGGRSQAPAHKGYVMLNIGPNRRMFEHRVVMERHLRRKLQPSEVVHHRNGNRADNRISNLVVCKSAGYHSAKYHPRKRLLGKFLPTK